ncbi:MAG: putative phage tail fiber protein [Anaerocolumna sp.]|jgi:hypothetical protein|nr:putative phage tail fiber protein [Anaerocolumna sp.]
MQTTLNFGLKKIELSDSPPDITVSNSNWDEVDKHLFHTAKFQKATGTATAITLSSVNLTDGFVVQFIASADNNGVSTTINGKSVYKEGTTVPPKLKTGKAVIAWYDATKTCFFVKASAGGGTAVAGDVLAGKTFSNDDDSEITGTIPVTTADAYKHYPAENVTVTTDINNKLCALLSVPKNTYLNGVEWVKHEEPDLSNVNIASGKIILGIQGSAAVVTDCAQITGLAAVVGFSTAGQIQLNWTNPTDGKIKGVRIMYKSGGYPTSPTDGTVFYDSSDAALPSTFTKTGFTDGAIYYIRAFAYTYYHATRRYTYVTNGAQVTATPLQTKGQQIFTSSGTFTVPAGVTAVDVFCVGGGAAGSYGQSNSYITAYGGGGGGGYTKTIKAIGVNPGQQIPVVVGAGGIGNPAPPTNGGKSSFGGTLVVANGGLCSENSLDAGGDGGSGGGSGYYNTSGSNSTGGAGGSDGGNGGGSDSNKVGIGQGTTTRAFGEATNTLYAGGGGGGAYIKYLGGNGGGGIGLHVENSAQVGATAGATNTGGGGGGGTYGVAGGNGGSGIVIVRWGY